MYPQTVLAMRTFVLAMSLYPDAQKQGQKAVDAVIGGGRLPDFSDFGKIPYVDAIVQVCVFLSDSNPVNNAIYSSFQEVLRWVILIML